MVLYNTINWDARFSTNIRDILIVTVTEGNTPTDTHRFMRVHWLHTCFDSKWLDQLIWWVLPMFMTIYWKSPNWWSSLSLSTVSKRHDIHPMPSFHPPFRKHILPTIFGGLVKFVPYVTAAHRLVKKQNKKARIPTERLHGLKRGLDQPRPTFLSHHPTWKLVGPNLGLVGFPRKKTELFFQWVRSG